MTTDLVRLIRHEIRSIVDPLLLRDRVFLYGSPTGQTIVVDRLPQNVVESRRVFECVADHAVAAGRVVVPVGTVVNFNTVRLRVRYAQPTAEDACRVLGITKHSAGVSDTVDVLTEGMMRNEIVFSFSQSPTRLFLGEDGLITTSPPNTTVIYIVGHAPSSDTVVFQPSICVVV